MPINIQSMDRSVGLDQIGSVWTEGKQMILYSVERNNIFDNEYVAD